MRLDLSHHQCWIRAYKTQSLGLPQRGSKEVYVAPLKASPETFEPFYGVEESYDPRMGS